MQEIYLVVAVVVVIAVVFVSLLVVVANSQKKVIVEVKKSEDRKSKDKTTIEMLCEIATKRNATKTELTDAILKAAKECPFPAKVKGVAPKSAKVYLNFILLVASHRNADAKLIAYMDTELKKANPDYKQEIDIYENEGINQRGNRL